MLELWLHITITISSKILLTKIGSHGTFLGKLISSSPLHDLWPHAGITRWTRVIFTKVVNHRTFLYKLTPGWPLHDLWPHKCITLCSKLTLVLPRECQCDPLRFFPSSTKPQKELLKRHLGNCKIIPYDRFDAKSMGVAHSWGSGYPAKSEGRESLRPGLYFVLYFLGIYDIIMTSW